MAIDVVVVNFKTPDLLADFCRSYDEHAWEGCSLTIVDVTLDSPYPQQIAEKHDADFISFAENIGYAKACNVGGAIGVNDVILLANADTVLNEGLRECYDQLVSHEDWGVLGPRQVDDRNAITAGGIFGPPNNPQQRGWMEFDDGRFSDVRVDALTVSGALYFVKRDLWKEMTDCSVLRAFQPEAIGAFLETKLYYEETFCSYHARAHGKLCVYYGPVRMIHYWHRSVNQNTGWKEDQMVVSREMHRNVCQAHGIVSE